MTEDTDAQALGMRPAADPVRARAGVPGPADGRHADVVTLREARKAKGMTLRDAAPAAGIDFTYLSKVETGAERPSDALVLRLCALYGIDPDPLLLRRAIAAIPEYVLDAVRDDATRAAEAEVAGLRDALGFVADWANDCTDDQPTSVFYGFADIETRCRAALAAQPAAPDMCPVCGEPNDRDHHRTRAEGGSHDPAQPAAPEAERVRDQSGVHRIVNGVLCESARGGPCDCQLAPEAEPEPSGPFDVGPPDTGDH